MKRSTAYLIGAALVALSMTACASTGPAYQPAKPPSGKAQIVVYRPDVSFGQLGGARLFLNGTVVCSLKKNTHIVLTVPDGTSILATRMWDDLSTSYLPIDARAGSRHFVRLTMNTANVVGGAVAGAIGSAVASSEGSYILRHGNEQEAAQTVGGC